MSALFKSFSLAIAAAALIAVTSGPVLAQNATVEERQKVMKSFGATLGMIGKWLKTGEGDPAALEQRLLQMAAAGPKIPEFFPKGTSTDDLGVAVSGAKPAIWEKPDEFKAASMKLSEEATKFAAVVKTGDKAAVGGGMRAFGGAACGTCHRPFRAKRPKN